MKKRTLQKILADPAFNPEKFLEQAIVEFVERYPQEVAKDTVALNHLVEDPDIAVKIVEAVDVNNPGQMARYLESLSGNYSKEDVCCTLLGRLGEMEPGNAEAIFAVLKRFAPKYNSISRPSKFANLSDFVDQDRLFELMEEALVNEGTQDWEVRDWEVAIKTPAGVEAFIKALEGGTIKLKTDGDFFPLISRLAKRERQTTHGLALLDACRARWTAYVCFSCGRGSGVDRNGNAADTNVIKSISGYTLHRNGCDKANEDPSPWKTINGVERELSFDCDRCGQTFTTASGLTLHRKKC